MGGWVGPEFCTTPVTQIKRAFLTRFIKTHVAAWVLLATCVRTDRPGMDCPGHPGCDLMKLRSSPMAHCAATLLL